MQITEPFSFIEHIMIIKVMKGAKSMKDKCKKHPCPYYMNMCPFWSNMYFDNLGLWEDYFEEYEEDHKERDKDYGPKPFVINIEEATKKNKNFRTALWTGKHLQLTLMSINVGEDIGLEIHPNLDQFIRIEEGQGIVKMGDRKDRLDFEAKVSDDYIIIIPAGKWHNLINTGKKPIKLYSIYAPPQHPWGTVHKTKADAEAAEHH